MPKPPALPSLKKMDNRTIRAPKAEKPTPVDRPENPHYRPSREGMENLTGYFPPAVKSQLMELVIRRRKERGGKTTIQDLLAEAINDLFAKSDMPEIAPVNRKEGQG